MLDSQRFAGGGAQNQADNDDENVRGGDGAGNADDHGADSQGVDDGFGVLFPEPSAQEQAQKAAQKDHGGIDNGCNQSNSFFFSE